MEIQQDDELVEGEIYAFRKGTLKRIERDEDDLKKIHISDKAHTALLDVRRRCRKATGGFRPDIGLVASALIEFVAPLFESAEIVAKYHAKILEESKAVHQASSLDSSNAASDDAAKPLQD